MLFGDLALAFRVVFFLPEQGQIAIQIPLEFIVEEHADRPASAALNASSLLLVKPVEIGVVFDLAQLHQTVVDGLIVGELAVLLEETMCSLGERYYSQGLLLRDFKGLLAQQGLPRKIADVLLHPLAISGVGKLREVRRGNHAEFADFLEGMHLGIAEEIRPVTDVILAPRVAAFLAGGMLLPSVGAIATARGLRRRNPTVSRVGRCRSGLT